MGNPGANQLNLNEDVQRLKTDRINAALSVVKSVENSPYISSEQALGIAMAELAKVQAYERITLEFIKSGEYGELPTEAEQTQANKDAHEAEEARRDPEADCPHGDRPAEGTAEPVKQPEGEGHPEQAASPAGDTGEAAQAPQAKRPERPAVELDTPEQRKVRRAKAKAAYAAAQQAPAIPEMPLDRQA